MSGYIPAPALPTRLRLGSSDTYQSGDITLTAGAALIGSRTGKNLQLDGINADPVAPSGLFVPGTVAALSAAGEFRQVSSSGASYLQLVEANLKTAVVAADAVNNFSVRVRGRFSGSLSLPMQSASRHFSLAGTDGAILGARPGGGIPPGTNWGRRCKFKPTANMTVGAIAFGNRESVRPLTGIPKSYYIWAADGTTVLAQTYSYLGAMTQGADGALDVYRPLKTAVNLVNGTEYWVGCLMEDGGATTYQPSSQDGSTTGSVADAASQITQDFNGAAWASPVGGGCSYGLLGRPGGTLLIGDVFIDLVQNGTGGTPGADLNVRLAFGVAS